MNFTPISDAKVDLLVKNPRQDNALFLKSHAKVEIANQPVRRGWSWELTIKTQRINFLKLLHDNPGLTSSLEKCMIDAYQMAIIEASQETGFDENTVSCPWSLAEATQQGCYLEVKG